MKIITLGCVTNSLKRQQPMVQVEKPALGCVMKIIKSMLHNYSSFTITLLINMWCERNTNLSRQSV